MNAISSLCAQRERRGVVAICGLALALAGSIAPAGAATNIVRMSNFSFQPRLLTINAGDTVLWTNTTVTGHDTTSSNSVWRSSLFTSPGTFSFKFTNAGTYGYFCTPHVGFGMTGIITVQGGSNAPPTVALTDPTNNTTVVAPATLMLRASAADTDGTVTNVQFFQGATMLGSVRTSPYQLVHSNLAAQTYSFSARAFDNSGAVSTSAVVAVTVVDLRFVTPSAPGTNFPLTLIVTPGQTYAIESSTNLPAWEPFTNFVADSASITVPTPVSGSPQRFYRGRVVTNP